MNVDLQPGTLGTPTVAVTFSEDATLDGIEIVNVNPNRGSDSFFKEVQFSLVFVGLKEKRDTYPAQVIYLDPFLYNFANR